MLSLSLFLGRPVSLSGLLVFSVSLHVSHVAKIRTFDPYICCLTATDSATVLGRNPQNSILYHVSWMNLTNASFISYLSEPQTSENESSDKCAQRRFRSACAFAHSDQNFH